MNRCKISIITVSYNAAATLEQTILSVINQTYFNIEYIIIDGGSNDGTVNIIKKYEKKISIWISESDEGIYDAMNKGIELAKGDYIYFLGADDILEDQWVVENLVNVLNEKIDILYGNIWKFDYENNIKYLSVACKKELLYLGISHQSMVVKKKILKEFKFDLNFKLAADYDFLLKCFFHPNIKFSYVDIPIARYSISGSSSTKVIECFNEFDIIMKKHNFTTKMRKKFIKNSGMQFLILKTIIKKILKFFRLWKKIQLYKGWKEI